MTTALRATLDTFLRTYVEFSPFRICKWPSNQILAKGKREENAME